MTIDQLPAEIVVPTRDTIIERHKRSQRLRVQDIDTSDGTQADIDARTAADLVLPIYAQAKIIGQNVVLEEARGPALDQWGEREGVGPRRDAIGGSGFVTVSASTGGGTVPAGDQLVHEDTGLLFETIENKTYSNGQAAGIIGTSSGTATNLAAGTVLKWTSPRPGIGATVTVLEQADGSGLSGGRPRENDDEYLARILEEKSTRAASGNDAEYQLAVQNTPQVAVQKAFTYPAILGPGTTAVAFTLRPARTGGSRSPNAVQIGLVEAHVVPQFPADDGAFFCTTAEESADIVYSVAWDESAQGWTDLVQWPPYLETGSGGIVVSAATSATSFTLRTDDDDYTGVVQPQNGQTIGVYDPDGFAFRRKRILSFTGTGPWVITVDTTNNVSDTSYTPAVGQRAMPWSESLDLILPGVHGYFDTLGPGEQLASFYDEGRRQKRQPRPPVTWPFALTTKGLVNAVTASEVVDVSALEGDGVTPSVGTPGVLSNILKLRWLAIFPES